MNNVEIWRSIRGYEGYYEVSSIGSVRRVKSGHGTSVGRLLKTKKPTRHCDYLRVQLSRENRKRTVAIHVLVAETFHGKRPRGKFPNHKDMNKLNNHADNLEWLTRKQNAQHSLRNGHIGGKAMKREENPRAKLTEAQVKEIRDQRGRIGQRILAALCGVSKTAIQLIHQGKNWPDDLRVRNFPKITNPFPLAPAAR